ncbi:hypothetical protein AURDEDRAFT_175891 [Auricularia subglabra TFB-10046 SS5]|uniref:Uncharacterized protein n=1 Tax=Auricularia subglabra (strain TFB-10046 / SS5) TaxID=717982 RepID=J0CWM7_AURST|nr:hypothetical protein AURDEDRAFT_175891 [Auricularia subglabra TFB-10046 SS5]
MRCTATARLALLEAALQRSKGRLLDLTATCLGISHDSDRLTLTKGPFYDQDNPDVERRATELICRQGPRLFSLCLCYEGAASVLEGKDLFPFLERLWILADTLLDFDLNRAPRLHTIRDFLPNPSLARSLACIDVSLARVDISHLFATTSLTERLIGPLTKRLIVRDVSRSVADHIPQGTPDASLESVEWHGKTSNVGLMAPSIPRHWIAPERAFKIVSYDLSHAATVFPKFIRDLKLASQAGKWYLDIRSARRDPDVLRGMHFWTAGEAWDGHHSRYDTTLSLRLAKSDNREPPDGLPSIDLIEILHDELASRETRIGISLLYRMSVEGSTDAARGGTSRSQTLCY